MTFLDTQALPDPEDILSDPQTLVLPRRGDLAVAIVRSVLARVESNNSIPRWERCCDVFETTYRQNKEVAMAGYGNHIAEKHGYKYLEDRNAAVYHAIATHHYHRSYAESLAAEALIFCLYSDWQAFVDRPEHDGPELKQFLCETAKTETTRTRF